MLSSMTGFASATGETERYSWVFEVKSVNGRGLDVRLNLPTGCEKLEHPIRSLFKSKFARGNMQASLQLKDRSDEVNLSVDTRLLSSFARRARLLDRANSGRMKTTASELFALRGVVSGERASLDISPGGEAGKSVLATVTSALEQLADSRKTEGEALHAFLSRIVSDMAEETEKAKKTADVQPMNMMARLKERATGLLEDSRISEERLEQELAILVSKADVTEEVDRLSAHFVDARRLLDLGEPVGRKLDFLSQELLREANTLGSKAASLEMTRHSLALKSSIDQFKEQVANVE